MTRSVWEGPRCPSYLPPRPAKILFVAEAPSDAELRRRIPLIGPSGQLFRQLCEQAGIDPEECAITNVFPVQLPNNSFSDAAISAKEARRAVAENELPLAEIAGRPAKDWVLNPPERGHYLPPEALPFIRDLYALIEKVSPNIIVALGGTALWALTLSTAITKVRGTLMKAISGHKLLPAFHPAYLLHGSYRLWPVMIADFIRARRESLQPTLRKGTLRKIYLWPETPAELWDWYRAHIEPTPLDTVIACDIETMGRQIDCISFAPSPVEAISIPFIDRSRPGFNYWQSPEDELEAWQVVKTILEGPRPLLFHNGGGFDVQRIFEQTGIRCLNYLHDTRLLHHALYPELPKSLKILGSLYTDEAGWKTLNTKKGDKPDDE